ncbi:Protein fem-1 -like protein [Toxocara canis]|uniref:Protein fem-1-like protein n=1 Tax=Toxocara canis TaxID=6265 RepID=A0A0B2V655_TOXCA|nr:Protein fem-1 -like protein [Toxocara canis]
MLKVLKHFGASFEIQNRRGDIPLHEAIQAGSKDIVEWLLALHPSTINSANHEGRTGLHLAAASGNMEIVVMLCSKNAEIDPVMFYKGALYTPLDFAKKKGHELVVEYLTRRHSAKTANQIPEDQRKDWMRKLEEQIEQAQKESGYQPSNAEKFARNFGSARKLYRRRSQGENQSEETQTVLPDRKPVSTNTSLSGSRRPSSASPRALSSFVPKSTSTTDLLNVFDNMAVGDTQAEREAVDERIKRIVQEQIQKAVHANEEEDLLKKDIEEADTSVTQSATEVDSIIAYAAQENSESKKKNKKSIRATSTKSKTKSRRRGDSEAKENVSPSRNVSKKSTKPQTPEASDEEDEPIASPAEHFDDSSDSPYGNVRQDNENNGSIDVVYSSAEDSGADSIAFEEFRAKARRALRDTSSSGVVAHRDIFDDNVRRAPKEKPKEKKTNLRYLHEKAIFNELTHLKKMQIQYGKVNERVLVRSLIGNFCKMHDLNPAHFKFQTFYAWEKFLYDQLKLIYMEERQRLKNTRPPPNTRFESRLRQARAIPINMRGSELMRLSDEQSSSAKSTRKSVNSRGTDKQSYTGHRRCDCLGNHVLIK